MRAVASFCLLALGLLGAPAVEAADTNHVVVPKVAITNLLAHKEQFKGKKVEVTGYYHSHFECSMLSPQQGDSSRVSLWIRAWGVKPEHKPKVNLIEKGNVRVIGTFDCKEFGSGHMGVCPAEINDLELFEPVK